MQGVNSCCAERGDTMKKIAIQGTTFDRRRKLSDEDKENIKCWYKNGSSIHIISEALRVSRRTVQFILFPERHIKNLADRAERGGTKQYYSKGKHRLSMRRYRDHLREVRTFVEETVSD